MKLETQVSSLELSKRLKELGLKQESLFSWAKNEDGNRVIDMGTPSEYFPPADACSAFTVAELGELLPDSLGSPPKQFDWETYKTNGKYQVQVSDYVERIPHLIFCANMDTEADARAGALIYLLENNWMSL